MPKSLNHLLLKAFKRSKRSAYSLGQDTGLAATTITRWAKGESEISLKTAEILADALKCKITCTLKGKR